MTELATFRDGIRFASPRWLRSGLAEKILYSIGVTIDGFEDWLEAAVKVRFPGVHSHQSLETIGRDRRIRRGLNESNADYAARLIAWLDARKLQGNTPELLRKIREHYYPGHFAVETVTPSGRTHAIALDGTITTGTSTYTFDEELDKWARIFVFYDWPYEVTSDGTWDDAGTWGDGYVWNFEVLAQDLTNARLPVQDWKAGHMLPFVVLLDGINEFWDYPAGTWDEAGGVWGSDSAVPVVIKA